MAVGGPHPESDAPRGPSLQEEAVWPIPVAIDNIHPPIAVEVSQRHATSMLVGVIQPWGATRGWGETGLPSCLCLPGIPPGMCPTDPTWVLPVQDCIPALLDALVHPSHPSGQQGSGSPVLSLHPVLNQPLQGVTSRASPALRSPTPGCSAATSPTHPQQLPHPGMFHPPGCGRGSWGCSHYHRICQRRCHSGWGPRPAHGPLETGARE